MTDVGKTLMDNIIKVFGTWLSKISVTSFNGDISESGKLVTDIYKMGTISLIQIIIVRIIQHIFYNGLIFSMLQNGLFKVKMEVIFKRGNTKNSKLKYCKYQIRKNLGREKLMQPDFELLALNCTFLIM